MLSENIRGQLVNESLNSSRAMDVQRDIDDIIDDLIYNELQNVLISYFDELLTKVISKLIDHHVSNDWKHEINQILIKNVITPSLNLLLQHSTSCLVKAIEIDVVQDLLVLHAQFENWAVITLPAFHGR